MSVGFGEIVEKLRRSTVQVKTYGRSSGSGVIWSPDGQIITNAHVIEGGTSNRVDVELWNGDKLSGEIIKRDRRRDLALVQVEGSQLPSSTTGDANTMRPGDLVIAVGNPFGFIGAASTGVIHHSNSSHSWLVSQIRLAPGNSGGPLANARGEVIGINTMVSGSLAFAVPSNAIAPFLNSSTGNQIGLGVVVRPVILNEVNRQAAFLVLEIVPDSPAHRASLMQGDLLLGAAGKRFQSAQDLEMAIQAAHGSTLTIQFRRGGNLNVRTVTAQMGAASVKAA